LSRSLDLTLGPAEAAVTERLARLDRESFAARLWAKDSTLWSEDPAHQDVARHRLGWLESPSEMADGVTRLEAFATEVAAEGFTHAVLLGMGGSSLAPEVLRKTHGVRAGRLDLTVLDNTSPAAVRAIESDHDPKRTLFVVSSKSGGTIEVASFERAFFERVSAALGERAGRSFIAITDPGTALEALARKRGYRTTFLNRPDIGGRYSALSYFGMVPAALIGADVSALLSRAHDEASASGPQVASSASPAVILGAALGELALAGRDKVTFVLGPEITAFASWVEQLVAESTGKSGKGLVPVADEPLGSPESYGADRVFVAFGVGRASAETDRALSALRAAGHPVLRWSLPDLASLGAEFLRWEIATATASAVLGVDPFDEPNVTEAKQATRAVLDRLLADGRFPAMEPRARAGDRAAFAPASIPSPGGAGESDPNAWAAALMALARPGDYFALLAYLHATPQRQARLERLRLAARARTGLATTLGLGPRFLHSTGQLHKGGPDTGLFLQLTADEPPDLPIPGERFGFAALRDAQASGDYQVLERRGRRVIRIHLGANVEESLDRLIEAVAAPARV
jgi:glucose-6-phosphate isomerase